MAEIITADWHLTDDSRDEYRWQWLNDFIEFIKNYSETITSIKILGDITEDKDNHSERLVNRITDYINTLRAYTNDIIILAGNHDGVDSERSFFRFLNNMTGVRVITEPMFIGEDFYMPHSRNFESIWNELVTVHSFLNRPCKRMFFHQGFNGVRVSNGSIIEGINTNVFNNVNEDCNIFSGHIHVPQQLGKIIYVGSPYPIYFGDHFDGRFIIYKDDKPLLQHHLSSIHKYSLTIQDTRELLNFNLKSGDQMSIVVKISKSKAHTWSSIEERVRAFVNRRNVTIASLQCELVGNDTQILVTHDNRRHMTDTDLFHEFAKVNDISIGTLLTGLEIINDN